MESKTRSVIGQAANLLRIESRAGDVTSNSLNDATLSAKNGKFRFESSNVFMPNIATEGETLKTATTPSSLLGEIDYKIKNSY